jgi:hypothetical protein
MSYLGQLPQTTRLATEHTIGVGSNQTIAYDLGFYQQGFIDVYVNGHRISGIAHSNDTNATAYYYAEGATPGTYDGRIINVHGLNHNDIVDVVNYSTLYLAGGGGAGGSIDQGTFNTMYNNLLLIDNGFSIDGGSF